ncbi:MAG TPA: amidohydrolase family protein [Ktedonobacteraceae bacterium]
MTSPIPPRLIDFHSHYYSADWYPSPPPQRPSTLAHAWPLLTNIHAQLTAMDEAGIDAKVLSAPPALIATAGKPLPISIMQRINDHFASLVAANPKHLLALATIDAFQGDAAAREVERAMHNPGLGGICVDCATADLFLGAPEARPTLETAAALGVPVFVHPVSPAGLTERLGARLDHTGILLARGTENAASVLALLRSDIFDKLPNLKIVLPMIGVAAFFFAGMADHEFSQQGQKSGWQGALPSETRKRLFVDTMGFDPAAIRFAVDLLGPEHVLMGSDWPIMPIATRSRVEEALATVGLTDDQKAAILGGNTLRLLSNQITP